MTPKRECYEFTVSREPDGSAFVQLKHGCRLVFDARLAHTVGTFALVHLALDTGEMFLSEVQS